jgi:hypothetical protein
MLSSPVPTRSAVHPSPGTTATNYAPLPESDAATASEHKPPNTGALRKHLLTNSNFKVNIQKLLWGHMWVIHVYNPSLAFSLAIYSYLF